jgi:hypothetical protein
MRTTSGLTPFVHCLPIRVEISLEAVPRLLTLTWHVRRVQREDPTLRGIPAER